MAETTFNVKIPSNLLNLGLEQEEIQRRISEWLVFSLFSEGKVSSGKAGKLLGISRLEFIQLLKNRGIAFINYSEDEVREELQAVKKIKTKDQKMIVVSDTTPLIGLASINQLDLLKELFEEVYIPQAVFDETVTFGRENSKAKQLTTDIITGKIESNNITLVKTQALVKN
ncbi:MAG: UPF0175 family protein [Chloroflexi bacterium]|nr:UPF0175 family protein [Chloroflexota bacterium]